MNTRITQAVGAALALGAAAVASAVDITGVPAGNILYVSGSTAIDSGLSGRFTNTVDGLCAAGTIDIYAGTTAGVKFQGVACTGGANAGANNGVAIAYLKEDNAGSLNGIQPVNDAVTLNYPSQALMTGANCLPNAFNAGATHACTATVTSVAHVSNFGFADVNAEMFQMVPLNAPTANLNVSNSLDALFGIGANLGFYHALQSVQGLPQDDLEADMPTLTRNQIYTILQGGGLLPPSIISNTAGTANAGAANVAWGGTVGSTTTVDTGNVYICVRGQSSGTMQTSQAFIGNIDCAAGVPKFAAPTVASCSTDGCSWAAANTTNLSFAGSGTGDVLSCLQGQRDARHFAIGIVGAENLWSTDQTNTARRDWRFIKINDQFPSIENAASDRYQYWAQGAGYAPKAGRPNVAAGAAAVTAGQLAAIGSAAVIQGLNAAVTAAHTQQPLFHNGFLAIPSVGTNVGNASSATNAAFVANPVSNFTRGLPANNCQSPVLDLTAPDTSNYPTWETTQP